MITDSKDKREVAFMALSAELSKTAAVDNSIYETEEDARNRRIAELIKRRQPAGLDTGCASPTPPKDSS